MIYTLWLLLYIFTEAVEILVDVRTNWTSPPFSVQLIEAVSGYDRSLYHRALQVVYGDQSGELLEWDDAQNQEENFDDSQQVHKTIYDCLVSELLPLEQGFMNLALQNKIFTPRIEAHYQYYRLIVAPGFEASVENLCQRNSFGERIEDPLGVWVKHGNDIYCSLPDLFALKSMESNEEVLAFDTVIGDISLPLLVLYGSGESPRFKEMLRSMLEFAASGIYSFVWRYTPPELRSPLALSGYGVELRVLNDNSGSAKPDELTPDVLPELSLRIACEVLSADASVQFSTLKSIVHSIPTKYSELLSKKKHSNRALVKRSANRNERIGTTLDLVGIYLNGAVVHRLQTEIPFVLTKLQHEVALIQDLRDLGFSVSQSKLLVSKYALMSAVKESRFRSGEEESRLAIYQEAEDGGLCFFNNLEEDPNYELYSPDREDAYIGKIGSELKIGQIPPLRENVHDIIFVINPSNKNQLKVFFAFSLMILDRGLPQQVGLIPLLDNEADRRIARKFRHILELSNKIEALSLLYKYYESKSAEEDEELLLMVKDDETASLEAVEKTLLKYLLDTASVIVNGMIFDMRSKSWQGAMGSQIIHDVKLLQDKIRNSEVGSRSLRSVLHEKSSTSRNKQVIPKDMSNLRYKRIRPALIQNSSAFKKYVNLNDLSISLWIVGDFNKSMVRNAFASIIKFMLEYEDTSIQVRVFNTAENCRGLEELEAAFLKLPLRPSDFQEILSVLADDSKFQSSQSDKTKLHILEENQIQSHAPSIIANSRHLNLDFSVSVDDIAKLVQFEKKRLVTFNEITDAFPDDFHWKPTMHFKVSQYDHLDWFDLVSSALANSFFLEDSLLLSDVPRFDFSSLEYKNSININEQNPQNYVDVLAIIDPADLATPKILSILESLQGVQFLNIRVLLQPLSQLEFQRANTFYISASTSLIPRFNDLGEFIPSSGGLLQLPMGLTVEAYPHIPSSWLIKRLNDDRALDFNHFTIKEQVSMAYLLDKIVVEGYGKDVKTAQTIPNTLFEASLIGDSSSTQEARMVNTLGYFQLMLSPGLWDISLKSQDVDLLSANTNKYSANDDAIDSDKLLVASLGGKAIYPRLHKQELQVSYTPVIKSAEINVFTIASGLEYEKLALIMVVSVMRHTESTVKFWLIDDFLSPQMRSDISILARRYNFEVEFVSYKWPLWLRQQQDLKRTVWAYKILFLDVIFPSSIDRVIFVDADQVARTDLKELMTMDLEGAPYGFPPMCESRDETAGLRFWKTGYWVDVLKDDLRYHISALFVVDLVRFRNMTIGDRLRLHYQLLSSDPNSLANLDQDLPNNMQRNIKIYSLPQEWLWCETWCSDETKQRAKMIDLCNNPLRKETKQKAAKRVIPEWAAYRKEVEDVLTERPNEPHDEL